MRLLPLFSFVLLSAAHGQTPAVPNPTPPKTQASVPVSASPVTTVSTFFGADLVEMNQSYHLLLSANRPDLATWQIDWGDGTRSTAPAAQTAADHVYANPGRYAVVVGAQLADGTLLPVSRDPSRLVQEDKPVALSDPPGDNGASPETPRFLTALTNRAATENHQPAALDKIFDRPVDQFSVEFWLRPNDLVAGQELVDAKDAAGTPARVYLENNALCLSLSGGDTFSQPLGKNLVTGTWHHIALTYDRAPTFPYSNVARFYLDGVLAGEYHLDKYDTGAVSLPAASIGSAADGTRALNGSIAEVAIYDKWLNPARLLDRERLASAPATQFLVVAPKNADRFTVDPPVIKNTVDVPLNPDPAADNGPALRAAIEKAPPGTRLRVVDATTHAPGARFYFNSLASGNDWTALRVVGKTDLDLDGGGAVFVFRTSVRQLTIKQSTRVAFRNFSIDLDQDKYRVGCYAKILDVDPTSGTVRFQFLNGRDMTPDRKVPLTISMWRWRSIDPKTYRILGGTNMFFNTWELFRATTHRDPGDPSILIGETHNARMLDAFEKYREAQNFLLVNNSDFKNTSVSMWVHCSQITFDHVNFYATLGMVFLASDYDHLQVTHCRIGLPPGETVVDRPFASGADGFHFHENLGHTLFEDNEITLTDDDPISIKDGIWRDVTAIDGQTLKINDFNVGEEIELYHNDLSPLNYTGQVTAAGHGTITVDPPLPADLPMTFLAQNHRERSFNWVLKDSYFHDYYGRFLVYTPWARITGNLITKSYLHIGTGAASFDGGGISSHVLVDNNILIETAADTGLWGVSSTYPVFQDITFADNSSIRCALSLNNTGNALVAGNYYESVTGQDSGTSAISIHVSTNPQVIGNVQAGMGLTAFALKTQKTDGLQATDNRVMTFPPDMTLSFAAPKP
jgi:hypothetical protein